MARNPIVFSNGTLVSNAKVNVEGTIYDVEPAQYEGTTPLSASNLNQLQTNLYDYVDSKVIDEYSESTTDGYSANYVNNLNTYSTTEKRIGTYTDGRPLYRKTITGTLTGGDVTQTIAHNISNIDINTIKTSGSAVSSSNQAWYIPMWFPVSGSSGYITVRVDATNIYFNCTSSYFTNRPFRLDIEYAKTTD